MSELQEITPSNGNVYITVPAKFMCVYHNILILLAEYGEEALKDCKASCTKRNSSIIECYNMFNAAVAAYRLGTPDDEKEHYNKLANTLIKYIKAKINDIYKHKNNASFAIPIDSTGEVNVFVNCDQEDEPSFGIDINFIDKLKSSLENTFAPKLELLHYGSNDDKNWYFMEHYKPGSIEVYINGTKYWLDDDDYSEIIVNGEGIGIHLNKDRDGDDAEFDETDEVVARAIIIK